MWIYMPKKTRQLYKNVLTYWEGAHPGIAEYLDGECKSAVARTRKGKTSWKLLDEVNKSINQYIGYTPEPRI